MKTIRTFLLALFVLCFAISFFGQNSASPAEVSFTVSGSQTWTDTGLDLAAGDTLTLSAEPKVGSASTCNAQGTSGPSDSAKLPLASASNGAVIAKTSEKSDPVLVGSGSTLKSDNAGHLFLGINSAGRSDCSFVVKAAIAHAGAAAAAEPANMKQKLSSAASVWLKGQFGGSASDNAQPSSAANGNAATGTTGAATAAGLKIPTVALDSDLRGHLDSVPRRVDDHAGHLGDMVNFVVVGSEDRVKTALDAADWHLADVDNKEAGLKAVMQTYEKKDYLQMPMSHLYLWDRMQDFGYEQAQAFSVVASRHHFRIWKAPFTWNNETVWVGAATHDIGFEKDIRTGHITHKIDPNVDDERSNLAQSLEKSGKVKSMTLYLPPEPVQEAKNASGGTYHSDGRLLVVFLK